ncbi:MAG: cytidine deaminase [Candidatus Levybacteria bacterium]|nr:cytidine deaminase [Candidatus Levybacteria bacterium]
MEKESILKRRAVEASEKAFAPHSKFKVGASLITEDGEVFSGSNVEPITLSLGICAERNVVFQAVGSGHKKITGIVIYTPTEEPTLPCGACRELISEFGSDAEILSFTPTSEERNTIQDLLPKELE